MSEHMWGFMPAQESFETLNILSDCINGVFELCPQVSGIPFSLMGTPESILSLFVDELVEMCWDHKPARNLTSPFLVGPSAMSTVIHERLSPAFRCILLVNFCFLLICGWTTPFIPLFYDLLLLVLHLQDTYSSEFKLKVAHLKRTGAAAEDGFSAHGFPILGRIDNGKPWDDMEIPSWSW